ncbi:LPS export ABC transporter periplasmic protein LptC [Flavihumibacter sediminis]|nr:LPS export ABC transporter periplasmic protein LptC [Flavihumibacter sediminis]
MSFTIRLLWIVMVLLPIAAAAQITTLPPNDTTQVVQIKKADRLRYEKKDSLTELQMLAGNVFLQQDDTKFYCDSAVIDRKNNIVEAFGNVHINDADSIHTYSQYLIYYSDRKVAYLKKNVKLTDGKGVLTTNELEYNTDSKIGTYTKGGKVVSGNTVLTSEEATYYGDMNDVYFKKNVKMRDPQYDLDTDSLLYNTDSQIATFVTKTHIRADSGRRDIVTSEGYYDLKNKNAKFGSRPVIKDGSTTVIGDEVGFDDVTGESFARGNAVFRDSAQGIAILANDLQANSKKNTMLATMRPVMIIMQEKDSIYITADTLFTGRLTDKANFENTYLRDTLKQTVVLDAGDTTNRNRYFQAWHKVRIFSDSLQAVCDSMFYSGVDSVFRLFHEPIAWASGSQVTGDTMLLYTRNKKAERIQVFDNGMLINKTGLNYYNQLRGNTINGYFVDGAIDYMRAKGSSESIYYAQDEDSAYVGVNRATADIIDMFFSKQELSRVVFRSEVTGTMSPFRQVNHDEMRLRSFQWRDNRRPKTKFELFEDPVTEQ